MNSETFPVSFGSVLFCVFDMSKVVYELFQSQKSIRYENVRLLLEG